jgi:hypothetical protein
MCTDFYETFLGKLLLERSVMILEVTMTIYMTEIS